MPKFGTGFGDEEDEGTCFTNVGSPLPSPEGQKTAKKREREEKQESGLRKKHIASVDKLAESTEKISKAMERRTNIDGLKTFYQMYNEAGLDEEAKEALADMKARINSYKNAEPQNGEAETTGVVNLNLTL